MRHNTHRTSGRCTHANSLANLGQLVYTCSWPFSNNKRIVHRRPLLIRLAPVLSLRTSQACEQQTRLEDCYV
eukprot:8653542-Pyramimonas_sp.AAC.1